MKKVLSIFTILIFLVGCESTPRSNGFIKNNPSGSFKIGTQSSVDLVVELDKHWGVDYDKMRTFFVDTVKSSFEAGETFETLDGFIGQVKKGMNDNPGDQNWSMEGAFSIDANGEKDGEWVNAWFLVDASATQPKREIVEYYFVKNGKIHEFEQSRRVIID